MRQFRGWPGHGSGLVLCAIALAGACSSSGSLTSASSVDLTFVGAAQTWDLNKDNSVGCDEWKQYTNELFQAADINRDGMVGQDEYPRITKQDKLFETVGFGYFDSNGDGRIALAEFVEKPNPAFRLLDKNSDCLLDGNELVQTRGPPPKPKDTYGDAPEGKGPGGI